jgi:hypothetical protein
MRQEHIQNSRGAPAVSEPRPIGGVFEAQGGDRFAPRECHHWVGRSGCEEVGEGGAYAHRTHGFGVGGVAACEGFDGFEGECEGG